MQKVMSFLLTAMVIGSCQRSGNELTDEERTTISKEIIQITNSIYESGNRKDPVQLYSNFSDRTTGIFSGAIMASWEEHKKEGTTFFGTPNKLEYKIEDMKVDVLSRDVVVV